MQRFIVYISPLSSLGVGILFIVLAFIWAVPKAADLLEVKGHLNSYYHKQRSSGYGSYTTIVTLKEGGRFWTDSVDKDTAAKIFAKPGVEIRLYINYPDSTPVPLDGAIKSYGLWVNGQQIESLDSSLNRDRIITRLVFPALGIFLIVSAFYALSKR